MKLLIREFVDVGGNDFCSRSLFHGGHFTKIGRDDDEPDEPAAQSGR